MTFRENDVALYVKYPKIKATALHKLYLASIDKLNITKFIRN